MVEGSPIRTAYRNRINNLENSISSFLVNVVLKKDSLPHYNHNIYHFTQPDVWSGANYTEQSWPHLIGFFATTNSRNPDFTDNFTALTYMRYSECAKWANTFSTIPNQQNYRSDEYEAFKTEKAEKILDILEDRMPGIRSKIQSYTTASPLTYRDYIGTRDGTLYGVIKNYNEPLKSFITPRTKIRNLFLTGQNINLHGIMGVTVSSVVTCSEILGHPYLIDKIRKEVY